VYDYACNTSLTRQGLPEAILSYLLPMCDLQRASAFDARQNNGFEEVLLAETENDRNGNQNRRGGGPQKMQVGTVRSLKEAPFQRKRSVVGTL
jgi:hypothetical protein